MRFNLEILAAQKKPVASIYTEHLTIELHTFTCITLSRRKSSDFWLADSCLWPKTRESQAIRIVVVMRGPFSLKKAQNIYRRVTYRRIFENLENFAPQHIFLSLKKDRRKWTNYIRIEVYSVVVLKNGCVFFYCRINRNVWRRKNVIPFFRDYIRYGE